MMRLLKQKNKGGGFTLVETLVGLLIFSMSVVAMMSVLGSGLQDTTYAKQKIVAGYLAQEGIEYARNVRDTYALNGDGWEEFRSLPSPLPLEQPDDTKFQRAVQKLPVAGTNDEVRIVSTVLWTQGSRSQQTVFEEYLYNWIE